MRRLLFLLSYAILGSSLIYAQQGKNMKYNRLTPEEEKIILHKGTERAYTGKYTEHNGKGTYTCKRCDASLYRSEDKFDSYCGWPSFDDEIPGAIKHLPDADGMRTEIVCNNCSAHLGHVFTGEGFTEKNTRHCVNSISMNFITASAVVPKPEKAYFAGGCFWGMEYFFQNAEGVIETTVGYMGGHKDDLTYKEVCYTNTGHAEAIEVIFDPSKSDYETLTKLFFVSISEYIIEIALPKSGSVVFGSTNTHSGFNLINLIPPNPPSAFQSG